MNKQPTFSTTERREVATQCLCALIASRAKYNTKKQLVDNAIAFADMLARRLAEVPADAQLKAEFGQRGGEV